MPSDPNAGGSSDDHIRNVLDSTPTDKKTTSKLNSYKTNESKSSDLQRLSIIWSQRPYCRTNPTEYSSEKTLSSVTVHSYLLSGSYKVIAVVCIVVLHWYCTNAIIVS